MRFTACLLYTSQVAGKKIEDVKIVVNGAGASAVSCTKLYVSLGARLENIVMLDSKGVISKTRTDLNEQKRYFATDRTDIHTLEEAIKGADVFLGLSKGNVPVSYTHLDVYKRQLSCWTFTINATATSTNRK